MALVAARITPAQVARLDAHYAAATSKLRHELKCARSGPDVPTFEYVRDAVLGDQREVFVAVDGAQFACLAVVRIEHKHLEWLLPNHDYDGPGGWPAAVAAVVSAMHTRLGPGLWGTVANHAVRDAMLAAGIPGFVAKGSRMEWQPPG